MESFGIRIAESNLTFSAAHFITLDARQCERLHGHNYRVACDVEGPLNDNQYVVDFHDLHRLLHGLIKPLDHRVLLPTEHPVIQIFESDTRVEVTWTQRRWIFPRSDCVLLPVSNTTAELLAHHLGRKLIEALQDSMDFMPEMLRIELQEIDGHSAFHAWQKDP